MKTILYILYKLCTYRINYPIDSYLIYLTYEAPLPSCGSIVKYSFPNLKEFQLTDLNYNIEYIGNYFCSPYLSTNHFYLTLYWFLCQVGTTLFISSKVTKLVNASEVFRTLIYPFIYDDPYIPVLSPNMIKSIEAPFPCHLGIVDDKTKYDIENIITSCADKTLVVNLDTDQIVVRYNDETLTIQEFQNQFEEIGMSKYSMKRKHLPTTNLANLSYKLDSKIYIKVTYKDTHEFVQQIRGLFLHYFASLFSNYEKFIKNPESVVSFNMKDVFNHDEFLRSNDSSSDFYRDLFATRTWMLFIEGKVAPTSASQIQKHKHFDEIIKSLKSETLFNECRSLFPDDLDDEKERFEYLFIPEKYVDKTKSLQM